VIRQATEADLPVLQDIERAAGQVFHNFGMAEIANDEPPSLTELRRYRDTGMAWVSVDAEDRPVAYVIAEMVDRNLHIEQISVHSAYARRGIGRELLEHVASWAIAHGIPALTLTTFTEIPWNAPYYERCGFRTITDAQSGPELRDIRKTEAARGLDRWPRTSMHRDLQRP
jgi:GNAT superfamily N-acetyltransferase